MIKILTYEKLQYLKNKEKTYKLICFSLMEKTEDFVILEMNFLDFIKKTFIQILSMIACLREYTVTSNFDLAWF